MTSSYEGVLFTMATDQFSAIFDSCTWNDEQAPLVTTAITAADGRIGKQHRGLFP